MGYYFIVVGAIISLFTVWAFFSRLRLMFVAERVQGTIVGFDQKLRYVGDRKRVYYHPTIEFETTTGDAIQFTYGGGSTTQRGAVGDGILVLYDPAAPQKATVNSFMGTWAGPLAAAILGGGCLYGGIDIVTGS